MNVNVNAGVDNRCYAYEKCAFSKKSRKKRYYLCKVMSYSLYARTAYTVYIL